MSTTFAEIILVLAALTGFYKLLKPLQRRLEIWILDRLAPNRRKIIDVKPNKE